MLEMRIQESGLIGQGLVDISPQPPSKETIHTDPTYHQVDTANFRHEDSHEDLGKHFDLPSTYTMPTSARQTRQTSVIQAANSSPNR